MTAAFEKKLPLPNSYSDSIPMGHASTTTLMEEGCPADANFPLSATCQRLPLNTASSPLHHLHHTAKRCTTCAELGLRSPDNNKQHSMKAWVWHDLCLWTIHNFSETLPAVILHWKTSHVVIYLTATKKRWIFFPFFDNISLFRGKNCLYKFLLDFTDPFRISDI